MICKIKLGEAYLIIYLAIYRNLVLKEMFLLIKFLKMNISILYGRIVLSKGDKPYQIKELKGKFSIKFNIFLAKNI